MPSLASPTTRIAPERRQSPAPLVSGEPSAAGTSAAAPASRRGSPGRPPDPHRPSQIGRPRFNLSKPNPGRPLEIQRPRPASPSPRLSAVWAQPVSPPARALALSARPRPSVRPRGAVRPAPPVSRSRRRAPARPPRDLILAVDLRSNGCRRPIPLRPRSFLKSPPVFWKLRPPSLVSRS